MAENNIPELSGSWHGIYYHESSPSAHGFEAVFVEQNGALSGNILDSGVLGEARVSGTYSYPAVNFVKTYYGSHSVTYDGTIDPDGKRLSGTWKIAPTSRGTWIAWRLDEGEELDERETVEELEVERELVPIRRTRTSK